MALDPNIGRIKFLRSKTAGRLPTTADIDEGELALNLVDRTIYTRNGNNIVDIGFGLGGQVNGNITASGTVKATKLEGPLTGNADSATKLQNPRTLSWTGDATGSLTFDGSANVSAALTLANSGATAGTYKSVTVDAKGRVTAGSDVITGLVTSTAASGTTNTATSNTNTYLNIVEIVGSAATTVGTSTQVTGAGTVTVTSDTAGKLTITGSQNITGSATSITVQGNTTALEGTQLPPDGFRVVRAYSNGYPTPYGNVLQVGGTGQNEVLLGWSGADGGVADTFIRNKRDTASAPWSNWRKVVFEDALNSLTVDKANSLVTARTINGVAFNGTANIVIADSTKLPLTGGTLTGGLTAPTITSTGSIKATTTCGVGGMVNYSPSDQGAYLSWNRNAGGGRTDFINNRGGGPGGFDWWNGTESSYTQLMYLDSNGVLSAIGGFNGNAASATSLQTARTINGVSFNGTANITIADNTKLPLTGGTITGSLNVSDTITVTNVGDQAGAFKRLIQASTTTDGGYLAVGNNGENRGYVEIGTTDDADEEIYATQRASIGNTVSRRAKLLDSSGNTSFPGTVTAPTFSGALSGNAATATKLATARTINGVSFDGTANITVADGTKLPLAGGSLSGRLTSPSILIDKSSKTASGISWYSSTYTSWQDYMAQAGTTENGVLGNLTAPSGVLVTSWGKRSVIEPSAGYGWTFETVTMSGTTPTIVAEISSTGESRWSGAMTVVGNITATGNITAFSDARLKDNITKIPDALNKLNLLKGVTYTRKDIASDKQYAGLIAQDVQKVLPEAVATTEGDIISVDYNGVIGLLVEAIKELNNRIDKLERI